MRHHTFHFTFATRRHTPQHSPPLHAPPQFTILWTHTYLVHILLHVHLVLFVTPASASRAPPTSFLLRAHRTLSFVCCHLACRCTCGFLVCFSSSLVLCRLYRPLLRCVELATFSSRIPTPLLSPSGIRRTLFLLSWRFFCLHVGTILLRHALHATRFTLAPAVFSYCGCTHTRHFLTRPLTHHTVASTAAPGFAPTLTLPTILPTARCRHTAHLSTRVHTCALTCLFPSPLHLSTLSAFLAVHVAPRSR